MTKTSSFCETVFIEGLKVKLVLTKMQQTGEYMWLYCIYLWVPNSFHGFLTGSTAAGINFIPATRGNTDLYCCYLLTDLWPNHYTAWSLVLCTLSWFYWKMLRLFLWFSFWIFVVLLPFIAHVLLPRNTSFVLCLAVCQTSVYWPFPIAICLCQSDGERGGEEGVPGVSSQ